MRNLYLSHDMLESEMGIAYEVANSFSYRHGSEDCEDVQYVISVAHSQGFDWNQDLFATRYEQMCQVVYDGHLDSLEVIREQLKEGGFEDEEGYGISSSDVALRNSRRRISDALVRPRRKSDRSVSFSADREQGTFRKTEVVVIDVDSDTEENKALRCIFG